MPYTGASSGGGGSGGGRGGGGGGRGGGRGGGSSSSSSKSTSRSYPRGVGPDFRKLTGLTLLSYIDHHGVSVRDDAPPSELAVAVARHFETLEVPEEDAVDGFLERLAAGEQAVNYQRKTAAWNSNSNSRTTTVTHPRRRGSGGAGTTTTTSSSNNNSSNARRRQYAARPGEQVAAKVTRTDENGSWILAAVQRFYPETETYDVQDEDDTSKLIRLPWTHVMQLSHHPAAGSSTTASGSGSGGATTTSSGGGGGVGVTSSSSSSAAALAAVAAAPTEQRWYTKNKECMAIFPETTSFYRAIVSKAPVWTWDEHRHCPVVQELVVKFEDDEDAAGRTPHRRVPSRYVIPLPSEYFHNELEDVDLTSPTTSATLGAATAVHYH